LNVLMLGSIPPPYGGVNIHVENLCRELSKIDDVYLMADRPLDRIKSSIRNGYRIYRPLVTVSHANAAKGIKDFSETTVLNIRGYGFHCIKTWGGCMLCTPIFIRYGLRIEIELLYVSPLHEILNTRDIDVIHAHHASGRAFRAILATRITRKHIPVVVTMHRGELEPKNHRDLSLTRHVFDNASRLVAVSTYIKNKAVRLGAAPEKVTVIPNGVDTRFFKPLDDKKRLNQIKKKYGVEIDSTILLFVGQPSKRKGIESLVNVLSMILNHNLKIQLLIVGKGPRESILYRLVNSLGLNNNVVFMKDLTIQEIREVYWIADIFILPSSEEGLSSALLEALSCGKAVLTTYPRSSLRHDAVIDGFNGLLLRTGDLDVLSSKLQLLIEDVRLRRKLGENARRTAMEMFDWSIIASKVHKLYGKVVG